MSEELKTKDKLYYKVEISEEFMDDEIECLANELNVEPSEVLKTLEDLGYRVVGVMKYYDSRGYNYVLERFDSPDPYMEKPTDLSILPID